MNKIVSFLIIVGITIFNCTNINLKGFYKIETVIKENSEFVESGVKVSYTSANSTTDELSIINKNLNSFYKKISITNHGNCIQATKEDSKFFVEVYENGGKTYTEINIINYDKSNNLYELLKELTKLQSKNNIQVKYFKYIKGKINNETDIFQVLKKKNCLDNFKILNIHNGYVGTVSLFNGERVNFAYSIYDTGAYFIIGTPIIYTTY